jgi:predicted nucleic acid-binding protein
VKVYLDNVIASGRTRNDLASPEERRALDLLLQHPKAMKLEIVTSRESWREQDRARDPNTREELRAARAQTPVVTEDHRVLGFNAIDLGYSGFIASPLVTDILDEGMFHHLKGHGLRDADARHLMYALCNDCDRFITTDPDFLDRRPAREAIRGRIRIVKPSEMLQEMEGL